MFEWLCEKHDVNEQLLALERLIQAAEEDQLRALAERRERESAAAQRRRERASAAPAGPERSPEELVRAERLRVLEEERAQLQALAAELEDENRRLQEDVEARRAAAAADVQRLQQVAAQLDQVGHLARDYASAP